MTSNFSEDIANGLRNLRPPPQSPPEPTRVYPGELPGTYYNDPILEKFLNVFATCPVCNSQNHQSYLEDFYFSTDLEKVKMREQLLEMLEHDDSIENVKIGIPCCNCFDNIFGSRKSGISLRQQIMDELRQLFNRRNTDQENPNQSLGSLRDQMLIELERLRRG